VRRRLGEPNLRVIAPEATQGNRPARDIAKRIAQLRNDRWRAS